MVYFIYGGAGSGKSVFAEECMEQWSSVNKYYLATMLVGGKETEKKVEKHRKQRANKGFKTIEKPRNLQEVVIEADGVVLVECVSNLVANEMFHDAKFIEKERVVEQVWLGIESLTEKAKHVVIVSNNVFEDGKEYDSYTKEYLQGLGEINQKLANKADVVYEVVVGIPIQIK